MLWNITSTRMSYTTTMDSEYPHQSKCQNVYHTSYLESELFVSHDIVYYRMGSIHNSLAMWFAIILQSNIILYMWCDDDYIDNDEDNEEEDYNDGDGDDHVDEEEDDYNPYSITISFPCSQILTMRSPQNFAHDKRTVLSWHVANATGKMMTRSVFKIRRGFHRILFIYCSQTMML